MVEIYIGKKSIAIRRDNGETQSPLGNEYDLNVEKPVSISGLALKNALEQRSNMVDVAPGGVINFHRHLRSRELRPLPTYETFKRLSEL